MDMPMFASAMQELQHMLAMLAPIACSMQHAADAFLLGQPVHAQAYMIPWRSWLLQDTSFLVTSGLACKSCTAYIAPTDRSATFLALLDLGRRHLAIFGVSMSLLLGGSSGKAPFTSAQNCSTIV